MTDNTKVWRPRLYVTTVNIESLYVHEISEVVKFHVVYGGISRTPLLNFVRAIENIAHRLFLGLSHIGGR